MELLVLGLLVWVSVHMIPVAFPSFRQQLVNKLGEMPYKGLFALTILGSVGLMVVGWRSVGSMISVYDFYTVGIVPALLILIFSAILLVGASVKSNFKRTFRHPQLMGVTLWAVAHLLVNGELRSIILFGGLGLWAVATMGLINKRDGEFKQPKKELPHKGVMVSAIGFVLFFALVLGHGYFTGVDLTVAR